MNPTPERALELADKYERQADFHLRAAASDMLADDSWQREAADACLEKASFLRAYADLAQKWQAVLDAEPLAWQEIRDPCLVMTGKCPAWSGWEKHFRALIIKPTA